MGRDSSDEAGAVRSTRGSGAERPGQHGQYRRGQTSRQPGRVHAQTAKAGTHWKGVERALSLAVGAIGCGVTGLGVSMSWSREEGGHVPSKVWAQLGKFWSKMRARDKGRRIQNPETGEQAMEGKGMVSRREFGRERERENPS